ncbi:MAG: response regulator transcription factor [Myxococcales bacterium]|nr:response regulator transcription factor [Myxococcales bacterium]
MGLRSHIPPSLAKDFAPAACRRRGRRYLGAVQGAEILVVDDDRHLQDVLEMALSDAGFMVRAAYDGAAGWAAFTERRPDLCVLDVTMPELDGFELCRRIRRAADTPVVMLTSRDDELDKVVGLEIGADDYVTKPFSTRELVARLRAHLRRVQGTAPEPAGARCVVGALSVDRAQREIRLGDDVVRDITATEFELLWALVGAPGLVKTRDDLVDAVYGEGVVVAPRTIDTFVKRLRRKLREVDPGFDEIETIRAVGYRYRP